MAGDEVHFLRRMTTALAPATSCPSMILIGLLTLGTMPSIAQTVPVKTVIIKSAWSGDPGFGPSPIELRIQSQGDNRFDADGTSVSANLIEGLVRALDAPPIMSAQSSNLGITEKWLQDNAEAAARSSYSSSYYRPAFRAAFTNRPLIEAVLPSLFSGFYTDDMPSVYVEVVFVNGSKWSAASTSQHEFMVPWRVDLAGRSITTWNAKLSRSVAALMPQGGANRERLEGERFSSELGNAAMKRREAQWMEPAITLLRSRYTIKRASIGVGHSLSYGKENLGHPEEAEIVLQLGCELLPQWLLVDAVLSLHKGTVDGADQLLRRLAGYEKLVLSIHWLNQLLTEHPQEVDLKFVNGRSLSEKALATFESDMRAMGKESLIKEVRAVEGQVALIEAQYMGYWLVLPDKRMVLWRFHTLPNVPPADSRGGFLKWSQADLPVSECAESLPFGGHCAGAIVSTDGDLVK